MVADRWSVETCVPTPRFHAGVTRVGGTIFIIGGFLDDDMFDRATGVTGSASQLIIFCSQLSMDLQFRLLRHE